MIQKSTWVNDLRDRWPVDAWDYFMRLDDVMNGKSCIAPEVSRNKNIGKKGSTMNNKWYSQHVERIEFFSGIGEFGNLDYLIRDNYDKYLQNLVNEATFIGQFPTDK